MNSPQARHLSGCMRPEFDVSGWPAVTVEEFEQLAANYSLTGQGRLSALSAKQRLQIAASDSPTIRAVRLSSFMAATLGSAGVMRPHLIVRPIAYLYVSLFDARRFKIMTKIMKAPAADANWHWARK